MKGWILSEMSSPLKSDLSTLPDLQGCNADQGKDDGKNPKADGNHVFRRTDGASGGGRAVSGDKFEMMMKRRTAENAPAFAISFFRNLEPALLYQHTGGFHHKNAADNDKYQFLFDQNGDGRDAIVKQAQEAGMEPVIPPRKNRREQRSYDKGVYTLRHLVENAFLHLKQWRGIATRYAKNAASFLAAVQIRCLTLWLKIS
jgi:transposase